MRDIIGMNLEKAEKELSEQNFILRVVKQDGEDLLVTMDYCPSRVNVSVVKGVIDDVGYLG